MCISIQSNDIRLFQDSDFPALASILASHPDLWVLGDDMHTRLSQTESYITSRNYTTCVCIKNSSPVGFITYVKDGYIAPVVDATNFDPKKPVESVLSGGIQLLAVQDNFHHQGIGKSLLAAALEDMNSKKIKAVIVSTKVANVAARSLYEKFGFKLFLPIVSHVEDCFYRCILQPK